MERLRRFISNINAQLSVLSVSQRIAIGLCAALAVVSLLWLMQWSTTPDMVPLVTHDFNLDELASAESSLKSAGIAYQVIQGRRILVPPGDQHNALRVVNEADALPDGSLFDMESVVTDSNPFESPEARLFRQNYARANELAKIIATSPFVRQARVMINPVTKRRLGGASDVPTASVTVTLAGGQTITQSMVEGFAKLVSGAVAGLKPYNVAVIDSRTMQSYALPHPEDAAAWDVLTMVKRREEHIRSKIQSALADIPGVRVAVTVDLDMTKRVTQNLSHDPPEPRLEKENNVEDSSGAAPTEPGVQANLGQAVTAASAGKTSTTEERTTENFEPKLAKSETIEQMPFSTRSVSAAIGIPRSFVVGVLRAQLGDPAAEPKEDDSNYVAVRDAQVARVRSTVERIVMAKSRKDVEVDVYPDVEWAGEGGVWSRGVGGAVLADRAAADGGLLTLVRTFAPQAGLALLALISLVAVARIVKKSADLTDAPVREGHDPGGEPGEEVALTVSSAPIGQAAASESLLTGMEVDPDMLRYQEIGAEVSKMVDKDPEGTADLIRRWVESSS